MPDSRNLRDCAYVAVDIETTGCCPGQNSIIEIGAARVENGVVVAVFSELVAATEPIPYQIAHLTGINDTMLHGAPDVTTVVRAFAEFAKDAILVAHNHRFDLGFLDYEAERLGMGPFNRPILDTLNICRVIEPDLGKYNLKHLAEHFGAPTVPNHRAAEDARATIEVFVAMWDAMAERGLTTVADVMILSGAQLQRSLVGKLPLAIDLPAAPGVYVLRDAIGQVVFVGSAKNLRLTVRNGFYSAPDSAKLAPHLEAEAINHIECASDLEAMLLERRLIHRYQPRHNDIRVRGGESVVIHVDTESPYPSIRATRRPAAAGFSLGPFTSRVAAERTVEELRETFGLRRCARRVDDSLAQLACRHRDAGTCPSPCTGAITPKAYQKRVNEALAVFEGSGTAYRTKLVKRQERAQNSGAAGDAVRLRETVRAFERVLSTLATLETVQADRGSIIVGSTDTRVTLHLLRGGRMAFTLRTARSEAYTPEFSVSLARAVQRVYFADSEPFNPLALGPRQLRELLMVSAYRREKRPIEVSIGDSVAATVAAVRDALGIDSGSAMPANRRLRRQHVVA